MSAETLARASEAVADKRWRWAQRMLALDKYRQSWTVVAVDSGGDEPRLLVHDPEPSFSRYGADASSGAFVYHETCDWRLASELLPDLDDAATLGCLLALVREAWGRDVFVEHHGDGLWRVHQAHREYVIGVGRTEAAALVAALRGAP